MMITESDSDSTSDSNLNSSLNMNFTRRSMLNQDQENQLTNYLQQLMRAESDLLIQSRKASEGLGLSKISLSQLEGGIISFLMKLHGPKKIVEIGTLTGASAQYILQNLSKDSQLWTFEKSPSHARLAKEILSRYSSNVYVVEGDAEAQLQSIEGFGPFDGIFIDGNKLAYVNYLNWAEKNLRPGGIILADNVFLGGGVWGHQIGNRFSQKQIEKMQEFNMRISDPKKYTTVFIPTIEGLSASILNSNS